MGNILTYKMFLVIVFILTSAFLLHFCLSLIKWNKKFICGISQPPRNLIFGHSFQFKDNEDVIKVTHKLIREYGKTIVLQAGVVFAPVSIYITVNPKLMEFFLIKKQNVVKSFNYQFLKPWLGDGLLISDGHYWKRHRKILTPAFHFDILKEFVETFEKCGDIFVEKLKELGNTEFDIQPLVSLYTLDTICETAMGTKINAQGGQNRRYVNAVQQICRIVVERVLSPLKVFHFTYWMTADFYLQKRLIKILHDFTLAVISEKKKKNITDVDCKRKKRTFLDLLLEYSKIKDNFLTEEEIRAEVDTFMFEGHDTTSAGISFTIYCLSENPHIQDKIFEEQLELFGCDKNPEITFTELQSMKYLEKVIKESLRLYPPVAMIGQAIKEDIQMDDGSTLLKGTDIVLFTWAMHRDPEYFTDPEIFNPERFDNMDKILPFSYLPFSAGSRNCIGQKFAMLEMKSTIAKIVRHFKILPPDFKQELAVALDVVLKSKNGIKVKFEVRK